jgi:hypothetical protein
MLGRTTRMSPAVATALAAAVVFAGISYAAVGGSTPPVYKTATGTVAKAPNPDESSHAAATATCDPGQKVVGGGVKLDDPTTTTTVDGYPDAGGTAWTAHVANDDPKSAYGFTVTAICEAG